MADTARAANGRDVDVRFRVNGQDVEVRVHPMSRLLDVLRVALRLTGTKEGCGEGECGACSVIVNGELVNSCLTPVLQVDGADITTIEGVSPDSGELHAVQRAFIEHGGAQCGICTPGMVMAALGLLRRCPVPGLQAHLRGRASRARAGTAMRSYLPAFDLHAPATLAEALALLGREPGVW